MRNATQKLEEAEKATTNMDWGLPKEIQESSIGLELEKRPERFMEPMFQFLHIIDMKNKEIQIPNYNRSEQKWKENLSYFAIAPLSTTFQTLNCLHIDTESMKYILGTGSIHSKAHTNAVKVKKETLSRYGLKPATGTGKHDAESMNMK